MKYSIGILFFVLLAINACTQQATKYENATSIQLNHEQASHLVQLPLKCLDQEYPNKLQQTLSGMGDLDTPKNLHPAFYGCFDWHSSVHGHWMMVKLLKLFPDLSERKQVLDKLHQNLSADNIKGELAYFMRSSEKSFERTYGWAWLLKLAEELHTWNDPLARELEHNLQPLTDYIVFKYIDFLPRLHYPVRVGEHPNTAFGLSFAFDYANTLKSKNLKTMIEQRAKDFYLNDKQAPLEWEPSGYDFLSPCLQESDLMRKVLSEDDFAEWLSEFLPQLSDEHFVLQPGIVSDRTDGKLVHLDGLNFSRAWCLYGIANHVKGYNHLKAIADEHIAYSLSNVVDGDYMGEHWLASFALFALSSK